MPARWRATGEEGYIVPIRDVDALVDAHRAALRDPALRAAMAAAARAARRSNSPGTHYRARLNLYVDRFALTR